MASVKLVCTLVIIVTAPIILCTMADTPMATKHRSSKAIRWRIQKTGRIELAKVFVLLLLTNNLSLVIMNMI